MKLANLFVCWFVAIFLFSLLLFQTSPAEQGVALGINSIQFTTDDGWRVLFRSDGSAKISRGATPSEWWTAPDLFDVDLIEAEIRPDLEKAKGVTVFKSAVSVVIIKNNESSGFAPNVENSEVIQNLFRQVLPHVKGIFEPERFRGMLRESPPFGIPDLKIRDDQTGAWHPWSITRYRESIYPREMIGEEDLSKFIIDRKSRAYVESLRKKRSAKDPSVQEDDGNERRAKGASVPGGHGGEQGVALGINNIEFTSQNGWKLSFRSDGSATVFYGSSVGDSWDTAPDIFDLDSIEAEIRPQLEESKEITVSGSAVAVVIIKDMKSPKSAKNVENSKVIQDLFRKTFENLSGVIEPDRLREMLQNSPPFGIPDLKIRDDQIGVPLPRSLTRYRESIYPRELTGEEDLSKFTIDRKSRAYVESLRKKRSAKDPSAKQDEGNERRAKGASVPGGHGGDARATPWWAVIAGAVAAVGLGWVLLRGKTSKGA